MRRTLLPSYVAMALAAAIACTTAHAERGPDTPDDTPPVAATTEDAAMPAAPAEPPGPTAQAILPAQANWVEPPNLPGLQAAWLIGTETAPGPYALRLRLTQGGRIGVHVHPDDRITTVLSGTLYVGFGTIFDETRVQPIPAGAVYLAPADQPHYVWARDGDVEYQESGFAPTATNFDMR
ncbi:cupin domain-containing protein [Zoogloea sp. LCSB751]|uniref:cupin domain-containing protein n=1 Tax=Zoogloea sp. LCSB751 TaxID=1965277 RepID=UPI001C1F9F1C|nr:cupin domain-containing protein [Zoogloea sp. LCSB751]